MAQSQTPVHRLQNMQSSGWGVMEALVQVTCADARAGDVVLEVLRGKDLVDAMSCTMSRPSRHIPAGPATACTGAECQIAA